MVQRTLNNIRSTVQATLINNLLQICRKAIRIDSRTQYDYVVDAIDTVTGKLAMIMQADAAGTPIISCMGAGNKINPAALEVADIYETSVCPLARVMRTELRKRGIKHLKVVYSKEKAITPVDDRPEISELNRWEKKLK